MLYLAKILQNDCKIISAVLDEPFLISFNAVSMCGTILLKWANIGLSDLGSNPRGTTNSVEIILPQAAFGLEI